MPGEYQIDAFGRRHGDRVVDAFVRPCTRICSRREIRLDDSLCAQPASFIGSRFVFGFGGFVGRPIRRLNGCNVRIIAFIRLKDRPMTLGCAQSPLHTIAIRALLDECPTGSNRLKIESIRDFRRGTDLD